VSLEGFLEIDARRIEAARWGGDRPSGPALVLLHEGLGCVAMWRDFPALLADVTGCRVFAYSRLGYGQSDPVRLPRSTGYMHEEAEEWLPRVLDVAGVDGCVLVGHSDGASIAAIHAGSRRDGRVRGLVLIAPHFFVEDMTVQSIAAIRRAYEQGDLRARLARYHADVDVAFYGWNDTWLDPAFRGWDITEYLPRIRIPALVLQGADDPYGTAAQPRAAERLMRGTVRVRLIAGARHAPQQEMPADRTASTAQREKPDGTHRLPDRTRPVSALAIGREGRRRLARDGC